MQEQITGAWQLQTWKRYSDDGTAEFPFGRSPRGILIYTDDGKMAVQMVVADRPVLDTDDPIGGSVEQRAEAYSTCLSYFGSYEVKDNEIVHVVDAALFPNWSNTSQARPFVFDQDKQLLHLQVKDDAGRVTSEIIWERK
ncbi:MAG: lipocalin-like domain-containing protein [Gammaproteobacteria bacterium]|jgi:hypothetical protein